MVDIDIRLAGEQELLVLYEVDHIARDDSSRRFFIADAVLTRRTWTIKVSKEIVGYGIISHEFFGRSFLDLIYIDQNQRSKGYGSELISFLETQSKSEDLFTSTNESNSHMQQVLEKLGYESSGIIYNLDSGDPEIVYVKKDVLT